MSFKRLIRTRSTPIHGAQVTMAFLELYAIATRRALERTEIRAGSLTISNPICFLDDLVRMRQDWRRTAPCKNHRNQLSDPLRRVESNSLLLAKITCTIALLHDF